MMSVTHSISYILTSEVMVKQRAYHTLVRKKYNQGIFRIFDYLFLLFWIVLPIVIYGGALDSTIEFSMEMGIHSILWLFIRLPAIESLIWSKCCLQFPRELEFVKVEINNVDGPTQLFFGGRDLSWWHIYMVVETVDGFLLYTSEIHYIWLPMSSLEKAGFWQWAKEAFNSNRVFHFNLNTKHALC